jgi:hypothetical protein
MDLNARYATSSLHADAAGVMAAAPKYVGAHVSQMQVASIWR